MRSSGDFLDMYLCAYVRSGSLHAFCGEQSADAAAGQLVLMDCRLPHRYCVTEPTELLWFHFSGSESAASTVQAAFLAYSREKMMPSKFHSMNF